MQNLISIIPDFCSFTSLQLLYGLIVSSKVGNSSGSIFAGCWGMRLLDQAISTEVSLEMIDINTTQRNYSIDFNLNLCDYKS